MNLKTIAKEAGVSTATVSNVINGNYHKVSDETIAKVQKIVEKNNYQPNATARSLASRESRIIGVVIPNIGEDESFSVSPYNTQLLALLEVYIRREGYFMMTRCVSECKEILPMFASWNVDGMVLLGVSPDEVKEIRKQFKVPTVYIDTYAENLKIANVGIDDYRGGFLAARYLLGKGHRKIAFVGPDVKSPGVIQQRYQGFCDACAKEGVEVPSNYVFKVNTTYQDGIIAGEKIGIIDDGITAVVATSDVVALGVLNGLRLCGLNVPNDVSVIGFDNLPECCYSVPQLTTISQDVNQKANLAGKYLFDMIRRNESFVIDKRIDIEIIERQSVKDLNLGKE